MSEIRSKFAITRLSAAERVAAERLAAVERVGMSELLRGLLKNEARKRGLWPPREVHHET